MRPRSFVRFALRPSAAALLLLGLLTAAAGAGENEGVVFRHALDDSPLDVPLPEGEALTEAVAHFHETGENLYSDENDEVLAEGRRLYQRWCQACHMPDGSGRIGPSLIDDRYLRARTDTDLGRFEIVYGGGAGAMQAFAGRLSQDQILRVIAYTSSLRQR